MIFCSPTYFKKMFCPRLFLSRPLSSFETQFNGIAYAPGNLTAVGFDAAGRALVQDSVITSGDAGRGLQSCSTRADFVGCYSCDRSAARRAQPAHWHWQQAGAGRPRHCTDPGNHCRPERSSGPRVRLKKEKKRKRKRKKKRKDWKRKKKERTPWEEKKHEHYRNLICSA